MSVQSGYVWSPGPVQPLLLEISDSVSPYPHSAYSAIHLELPRPLQDQAAQRQELRSRAASEASAGESLRRAGQFVAARERFLQAIGLWPENAEYHFLLGVCELADGRRDLGLRSLQSSIKLNPNMVCGHEWISQWYLEEGLIEQALEHSTRAFKLAPDERSVSAAQAYVLEAAGDLEAAWELLGRLLTAGYVPAKVATLYSRMAPRRDKTAEALALVNRCLAGGGYSTRAQAGLHFAAADLLDKLGRFDEAFAHAQKANLLKRPAYWPMDLQREIDGWLSYFTRSQIRSLPRATFRKIPPVFIVGMPRSGTSLVEQILASHPQIHGGGELDLLKQVVVGTTSTLGKSREPFPKCLDGLSIDWANGLAQLYLEPLAALDRAASYVTDKMPLNFMYMGLIALLFPDARIIHCRRDSLDTCLSCYMSNFAGANQFAYDLEHLGHFQLQHDRLINHWKSVLDLPIHEVSYELMVDDAVGETRRLLQFLALPWDDRCLNFHQTRRPVATASIEQVRRPIYRSSVGRWRNYEKHLAPLKAALGSVA